MLTWQTAYRGLFPSERLAELDVGRRAERWRREIETPPPQSATLVAELEGDVVGFAGFGPARDEDLGAEIGELYAIYVAPQAWGSGAGAALLTETLAALRGFGFREAVLWVLDANPRARRFYQREGWAADGAEQRGFFLDTEVVEVRYRISL